MSNTKILLNSEKEEKMSNSPNNGNRWFQWIKGENAGKTVEWKGDIVNDEHLGINFLMFTDGSRVNEELLNDWIIEVASPEQKDLILQNEFDKTKPTQSPTKHEPIVNKTQPQVQTENETVSPIHQILKDSKKTKVTINISLLVETPPANLMSVLSETYQDGEQQVLEYISNSINIDDIKQQIARQIWLSAFEPDRKTTSKKTKKYGNNESPE